jgi:hypothetical protein
MPGIGVDLGRCGTQTMSKRGVQRKRVDLVILGN